MFKRDIPQSFSTQLFSLLISLLLILVLAGCHSTTGADRTPAKLNSTNTPMATPSSAIGTATATGNIGTATATPAPTSNSVAFNVTGISVSVNPRTTCYADTLFTYTATITATPGTNGGTVSYTWLRFDNVPMPTQSVTFRPGETEKTVTTDWQDNIMWTNGEQYWEALKVTSPNTLTSAKALGTYLCNRLVTGVSPSVTPNVYPCAQTPVTFTLSATITISSGSSTVDIISYWRFSNGGASTSGDTTVPAGQTQITVTGLWTLDFTNPNGNYGAKLVVISPNSFISSPAILQKHC